MFKYDIMYDIILSNMSEGWVSDTEEKPDNN